MKWRPKLLAIAPYCDGTDVGEARCSFSWIKELSKVADVTLLTMHRPGRIPIQEQIPNVKVMSCQEPKWVLKLPRINAMAKLAYPKFYRWTIKTIHFLHKQGIKFDIAHQFSPIALRYPSPLTKFDIPYVLGPLGGSISTPKGFEKECGKAPWYTKFRNIDALRLQYDWRLKKSYKKASAIMGVAPYVKELIGSSLIERFEVMSELGINCINKPSQAKLGCTNKLRLLHVGRGVRTKGLRDCIRAMALVSDLNSIFMDVAGTGPEIDVCEQLAKELNVDHRITFHGQIPRSKVDDLYTAADVFCFPSFREPSGSVIFEALSFGLPVITADNGGPGHVIDDTCGFTLPAIEPIKYARDIASCIRTLYRMPQLRTQLSKGALEKARTVGLWPQKITDTLALYAQISQKHPPLQEISACKVKTPKLKSSQLPPAEATGFKC